MNMQIVVSRLQLFFLVLYEVGLPHKQLIIQWEVDQGQQLEIKHFLIVPHTQVFPASKYMFMFGPSVNVILPAGFPMCADRMCHACASNMAVKWSEL